MKKPKLTKALVRRKILYKMLFEFISNCYSSKDISETLTGIKQEASLWLILEGYLNKIPITKKDGTFD